MPSRKRTLEPEPIDIAVEDETLPDEIDLDDAEETEAAAKPVTLTDEPLLVALLRQTVAKLWPNDTVMVDFVTHVAGPISELLGTRGAKGGDFAAERVQTGVQGTERYKHDQSFRAHLLNGLFPVLNIARVLQEWNAPRLRYLDEKARRLFIAGYVLHDWLKFPDVDAELKAVGLSHDTVNMTQHGELVEKLFRQWSAKLGLPAFLAPIGEFESLLHDLIYLACNTQVKWGTLRNLSALPKLSLDGRTLQLCENLSTLADLLTYVAPTPRDITTSGNRIAKLLGDLSENSAKLVYHHVADNRGVLTNLIHNAALSAMRHALRLPFLYAPSGVVYLEHKDAPPLPDVAPVVEATVERVRQVSAKQLSRSLTGFKRDGKGLKRADYYNLFFDVGEQIVLAAQATFKNISSAKPPSSGKRFAKMRDGGWLDSTIDLDLADDIRVDQLAEWCYFVEAFINESSLNFDSTSFLFTELGLADTRSAFDAIPRDNRAGGVGYHWYFAAGHYLKLHPGKDPAEWQTLVENLALRLAEEVQKNTSMATNASDSWQELRSYTRQILSFGPTANAAGRDQTLFLAEFNRYQGAKRTGRGRTSVCSLCSSPFETTKQQEAAILFAPQVYSNKLPLHGATAIRDICPICGLETMLRQILMNRANVAGSKFEARQIRYLYFYPTYFFSPETLDIFRTLHHRLQRISFTELRRQLLKEDGSSKATPIRLDPTTLQRLEEVLLSAETVHPNTDRYIRMHFPEHEPITFYFLGIPPPSRDAKDAEAWVHPAILSLLLPVCVDVKVVASTSPLPLLLEATELAETVFLDGAHPFVRYLLGQERINIDQVLPCLQRLLVAYFIHLDAHSRQARGQWDYRWSDIPPLARDLSTDAAYAFHYLKKWQRRNETDGIPLSKAEQYVNYFAYLGKGGATMSHARELVDGYRQFYRARRSNSNSILRPLSVAAKAILSADRLLFNGRDGLIEAVRGELRAFMDRVQAGNADGIFPRGSTSASREEAMQEFAKYFVGTIFYDTFREDVAALRGRQLNLLKNAAEVLYRDASARDRQENQADEEDSLENEK